MNVKSCKEKAIGASKSILILGSSNHLVNCSRHFVLTNLDHLAVFERDGSKGASLLTNHKVECVDFGQRGDLSLHGHRLNELEVVLQV